MQLYIWLSFQILNCEVKIYMHLCFDRYYQVTKKTVYMLEIKVS